MVDDEWIRVANWVYENFDLMSGVSFFPRDNHVYPQAPYQEITEEEYIKRKQLLPEDIDFNTIEDEDNTTASQELACVGGVCEL